MAKENLTIQVSESGALEVSRNIDNIGKSAKGAANPLKLLQGALAAAAGAAVVQQFIQLSSAWTDLQSRIKLATGSMTAAADVTDRLQQIARRAYAPFENIAEIYLRSNSALTELGYTTQQQLDFTEAMNNAMVISGAKGERAESVMNALTKALSAGKLSGENWNTVLQQGGRIVDALAEGTGKSIRELREMAAAGKLSSETVFTALTSQLEKLQQEADAMPATINDAFVVLRNKLAQTMGEIDGSLNITTTVVKLIGAFADSLQTFTQYTRTATVAVISFGTAIGAIKFIAWIQGITGASTALGVFTTSLAATKATLTTLFATIAANPIAIGLIAIAAAATAAVAYFDKLKSYQLEIEQVEERIYQSRLQRLQVQVQEIKNRKTAEADLKAYIDTLKEQQVAAGRSKDQLAAEAALAKGAQIANRDLHDSEKELITGYTQKTEAIKQDKAALERILGPQREFAEGMATLARIKPQLTLAQYNDELARLNTQYAKAADPVKTFLKDLEEENRLLGLNAEARAVAGALTRATKSKGGDLSPTQVADVTAGVTTNSNLTAERALYDQITGPQTTYLNNLATLNRLRNESIPGMQITQAQYEAEKRRLDESQGGYSILLRNMQEENALLRMTEDERAKALALKQLQKELDASGGTASPQEVADYLALTKLNDALAYHRDLKSDMAGPQLEHERGVKAENLLYELGETDLKEYTAALDFLAAERDDQVKKTKQVDSAFAAPFKSAFAELTNFTTNGKLVFGQFVSDILAQIAQVQAQEFFTGLMGSLGLPNFATGGEFMVGGAGGTDSQTVAFRATPGERVSITPPGGRSPASETPVVQAQMPGIKILNVLDPSLVADALGSAEGEKLILNIIASNSGAVRQVIS